MSAAHLSGAPSARSSGGERERERNFFQTRECERKKFRNCARARTIMTLFCNYYRTLAKISIGSKISMSRKKARSKTARGKNKH